MQKVSKCFLAFCITVLCMLCVSGCGIETREPVAAETQTVVDSIGRSVVIPREVKTVAVANAYNTEIINALGVIDRVVGVDHNIYQDQGGYGNRFKENQVIGKDQRQLNYEQIIKIHPEVLILTGNGAVEEAEEKLKPFGISVVVVDAYYTNEFEKTCDLMGQIFNRQEQAAELKHYFTDKLHYIQDQLRNVPKRTLYFEYRRNGNTTVPGDYFYWMVEYSGADNIFRTAKAVSIAPEEVIARNPAYIVKVSDEVSKSNYNPPTDAEMREIKEAIITRPGWEEIDAVKQDRILLLSHYVHGGASKLVGTMYIAKFLYPEYLPDLHPEQVFKDWLEKYQHLPYVSGHTNPAFEMDE